MGENSGNAPVGKIDGLNTNIRAICVCCSRPFTRTKKELERLDTKKVPLPTRCPQCRKLNIIEEKLKFIIKILTSKLPVKVTTEATVVKITKGKHEQKLSKEQKQRVSGQA